MGIPYPLSLCVCPWRLVKALQSVGKLSLVKEVKEGIGSEFDRLKIEEREIQGR
jgi:hypothetical protein